MAVLQERRAALGALLRKYGADAAEVLGWAETARRRLEELDASPARREQLAKEAAATAAARDQAAAALTQARRRAGQELAARVSAELAALGMAGARFEVALAPAEVGPTGADAVEFHFTAHSGPARPLAKGASGGELSRVMLALEVASAATARQDALTLVFDEVDQGVGGAAALAVAERLARLAVSRQVIVVTHLPQIAAAAVHQVVVSKTDGVTAVRAVAGAERRAEVARMLAGVEDSKTAQGHAAELLRRDWVGQSSPA
jgi:DNA repair protein RecN (Recombination protein N)